MEGQGQNLRQAAGELPGQTQLNRDNQATNAQNPEQGSNFLQQAGEQVKNLAQGAAAGAANLAQGAANLAQGAAGAVKDTLGMNTDNTTNPTNTNPSDANNPSSPSKPSDSLSHANSPGNPSTRI